MKAFIFSWGFVIASAICDAYAAFVVKMKLNEFSLGNLGSFQLIIEFIQRVFTSPLLLSAVATFVAAPFLWFIGLSRLQLSAAYPVNVCMHLLLIFFFSTFFLGELITAKKMAASVMLVISLFLFFRS